ncbi:MAG TPA: BA14K family protein [Pseudolabrys sp.]|nr:BA14K family protein [Pseudolabrys sp.]
MRGNFAATTNGRNAGFVRSNTTREARSAGGRDYRNGNWRGDWRDRRGRNFARGLGFGVGTAAYYGGYYGDGYYDDGPYAYDYGDYDVYGAPVYAASDDVQYCMQRFRSYDPQSGTYLGYDGERHPCP